MTDTTTNPVDGEAMPEVVDDFDIIDADDDLNPETDTQEGDNADDPEGDADDGEEADPDANLEEVEFEGETYKVPSKIKEGLLRQADYTKKTQALAEDRRVLEARETAITQGEQRTAAFVQEIASLGALNARLQPFQGVTDWPSYLRQQHQRGPEAGAQANADHAEFMALTQQRDALAQTLGQKIQQRTQDEQREAAKQVEAGRAELAKHIKGYSPATLDKLATFAAPFGFSSDEVRQAEADPRSIRVLHLAMIGQEALQQQRRTSTQAQSSKTTPVKTLRGAGGRIQARPDTDDFAAFERMMDERAKASHR